MCGIRPFLGSVSCAYSITCGNYAVHQLQSQPLFSALFLIAKRLVSCNPCSFAKRI